MNLYEETLSTKNKTEKIKIIEEIFPNYVKAFNPKDSQYGELFDKLYDKDLSYLIILKGMYK